MDLSENFIYFLAENLFSGIRQLQELHLKGNKIEEIDFSLKDNLNYLKLLDLSWNSITNYLTNSSLYGLSSIEILHLGSNKIKSLNGCLINLKHLKHLDVSSNQIENLNNDEFVNINNLAHLNLNNNLLKHIDTNLSSLLRLQNLCLSNTSLNDIFRLNLELFELLEYLDLSLNNLKSIPQNTFLKTTSLKYLNLKHNRLDDFSFLANLYSSLHEIDLGFNQVDISYVVCNDVKIVRIQNTSVNSLDDLQIDISMGIEYLDLSWNNLKQIPTYKLSENLDDDKVKYYFGENLKFVDLSYNQITMINNSLFVEKSKLK